ncbi:MAG: ATP-binding protein [bacterium]|nr:ATP-binding protein [bacterium]
MLTLLDFRVRQRDFLLEIARAITEQLDLTEVLRRVLNASVVMLSGQIGMIALRDAAGAYRVRATMGVESAQMGVLNDHFVDLVASLNDNFDYNLMNTKLSEMAAALDSRLRQSFALPLVFADEPLGMLIIFRAYRGSATPDDVQVLQSFADQAAIAVHNAQLYERIDHERRRLAAILQHSADGVMILDPDLNITSFNRALERLTAWRTEDAVGKPQDEVIIWKRVKLPDLKAALDEGWAARPTDAQETLYVEGDLVRLDGLTQSVAILYAPLFGGNGRLANIIANVRDITNFRQAQEMQNTFISTVSHELKTPVALIKGHAATLRRDDVTWTDEIVREYSTVIEDESDRLTELIENLLTASRLQADHRLPLMLGDVQIDQVAARAVERFSTQTTAHQFRLNFPPAFPVIPGDETRLRQVIDNLLSNAIKYSPDGGVIEVGGRVQPHHVTVYIRDQGIGIKESDQDRVFDRFYRVEDKLSRRTQGTGLGLYLAKAIIEAHGGAIHVESQPGTGSTFTLSLPTA